MKGCTIEFHLPSRGALKDFSCQTARWLKLLLSNFTGEQRRAEDRRNKALRYTSGSGVSVSASEVFTTIQVSDGSRIVIGGRGQGAAGSTQRNEPRLLRSTEQQKENLFVSFCVCGSNLGGGEHHSQEPSGQERCEIPVTPPLESAGADAVASSSLHTSKELTEPGLPKKRFVTKEPAASVSSGSILQLRGKCPEPKDECCEKFAWKFLSSWLKTPASARGCT